MLTQLLQAIRAGGPQDVQSLAVRLNTSPQMVAVMLDHLQRSGYLKVYQPCGDGCGGCGLQSSCHGPQNDSKPKLWSLVEDPTA